MKQVLSAVCVLTFAVYAMGQEKETTKVTTKTTTVAKKSGFDLLGGETWNVTDAPTFTQGAVDLRLGVRYTENAIKKPPSGRSAARHLQAEEAWSMQPAIVWGATERLELAFTVPVKHIDDLSDAPDGNYDSYVGGQYRLTDQEGYWPAMALASNIRIPTGDGSNGMDFELRLVLTNEYESGIRSHLNVFGIYADTNNYEPFELRDFQYGGVIGLDGPLCADGAVRWVADWMYRISQVEGGGGQNMGEVGWQWQINERNKLGMSVQLAMDHAETTSDVGAALTYAYTIMP